MANQLQWTNALSTRPSLEAAVTEVVERAQKSLYAPAELALVFISSAFASEYPRLMPLLREKLSVPALIGCSGSGIVGTNAAGLTQEVEGEAALSLTLVHLSGASAQAFHVDEADLPDLDSPPEAWVELIGVSPQEQPHFVLLADAFSSRINDLLQGIDFAYPGAVKVGGQASGGATGNRSALFCNYQMYREGTVGVSLVGDIVLETIVAQGCRPIGQTYRVTKAERNIVVEIAADNSDNPLSYDEKSRPPLEVLRDLIQQLNENDRQLAQHSLFVGIVRDEFKLHVGPGDFLIRNLLGVDPRLGAIAIGDRIRSGQRLQFHLRDAQTSAEDLDFLLKRYQSKTATSPSAAGALMFSCVGRGEGLYGRPNFDSALFQQHVPNIPVGGFFCNGEIGPVGGSTFLHGYTSVFGICRSSAE